MTETIRTAVASDAESVTALTRSAYAKWVQRIGREPLPMSADHAAMIRDHQVDLLFADHRLVALVEFVRCTDGLLIENVAVDPPFQKRGYGRRLIAHVEDLAARRGPAVVRLYTNGLFSENVSLYLSLGYNVDRLEPMNGGVAVHMLKRVPQ